MWSFMAFFRWLQLKRFQFEITMSLYMMTPAEKFLIYSFIFLVSAMVAIALVLYFPEHISLMASRATFYWAGEDLLSKTTKDAIVTKTAAVISETATPWTQDL